MESLAERLQRRYAQHYARMNSGGGHSEPTPNQRRAYERTYGCLLRSLPPGSRVVDIGCGTGHLLQWLAGYRHLHLMGVDQSEGQLAVARTHCSGAELFRDDGQSFLDGYVGGLAGIFCFDVLEHLPEGALAGWMDSALRSLEPGGFFCCRCPNAANILSGYSRYLDLTHLRSFTRSSLLQLLDASGFVNCSALPQRGGWWGSTLRLTLEANTHHFIYHLCGRRPESIVTGNVAVVGHRPATDEAPDGKEALSSRR